MEALVGNLVGNLVTTVRVTTTTPRAEPTLALGLLTTTVTPTEATTTPMTTALRTTAPRRARVTTIRLEDLVEAAASNAHRIIGLRTTATLLVASYAKPMIGSHLRTSLGDALVICAQCIKHSLLQ